eukprot:8655967-Ditylum_brightwellii.AAC.1
MVEARQLASLFASSSTDFFSQSHGLEGVRGSATWSWDLAICHAVKSSLHLRDGWGISKVGEGWVQCNE